MMKFVAQAVVLGAQVVSRAFARALRQEYAATQAASQKGHGGQKAQAEANVNFSITLQEAKDILNINNSLDPNLIKEHFEHLFDVNDKTKGGSFYLQSKEIWSSWPTRVYGQRYFSVLSFNDVFSRISKERFIKCVEQMKVESVAKKNAREAAVLIPLCRVNGKPSVLLTMRSVTMGRNKGDASFPGGMKDISDKDSIGIALREAKEEIGLTSDVEIWATLPTLPSRLGKIKVTPVVAYVGDICLEDYIINQDEVEYIFAVTLESLCDPKNFYYTRYKPGFTMPVYVVDGYRVWGLTAVILHILLKFLLPDNYKNDLDIGMIHEFRIHQR